MKFLTCSALLLAGSVLAHAVSANAADNSADMQEAVGSSSGIQDIVVTAQRREQSLQDVPVAITAVNADVLARAGVADSMQLAQVSPGLVMTQQNISVLPYIRGIGSINNAAGAESPVATYIDGVYIHSLTASLLSLSNIERVEVLRGPQGVAFGRNATGGLVRIVTKDPSQTPEMIVNMSVGNFQTIGASAYMTGPLTPNIAASLAVSSTHQGKGYGRNITLGEEIDKTSEQSVRAELQIEPSDRLSINVAGDYNRRMSDIGLARGPAPGVVALDGVQQPWEKKQLAYRRGEILGMGLVEQFGAAMEIEYEVADNLSLTSSTSARRSDTHFLYEQDGTPLHIVGADLKQRERTFQQEILANFDSGPVNLIAGIFFYRDSSLYHPQTTSSALNPAINLRRETMLRTKSHAAFGQLTYAITPTTNITAGLRYTHDNKSVVSEVYATEGAPFPEGTLMPPAFGTTNGKRQIDFRKLTWRAAIDQKLNDNVMLFASYNRGFKSGGYNSTTATQDPVQPETLDAFEAGVKTDLFDRQLRFNLSGYYYDYKNIQLVQLAAGGTQLYNAAKAQTHGVELETLFQPHIGASTLQIRASAAYAWGEYKSFPDGPVYLPNPVADADIPAGTICPAVRPANPGGNLTCVGDLAGNSLTRLPKWTLSGGVNYRVPVGEGNELALSTDIYHSSSFFFEPSNRLVNPAYTIINAQIAYSLDDERFTFRIFGKNLTNTRYYTFGAETGVGDQAMLGHPVTYGFGFQYRFQ